MGSVVVRIQRLAKGLRAARSWGGKKFLLDFGEASFDLEVRGISTPLVGSRTSRSIVSRAHS